MCERLGPETKAIIAAIESLKKPAHENLNYQILVFELDVARVNEEVPLPGWFDNLTVGVIQGSAVIRLNEVTKDPINLEYVKSINTPFNKIFLTNVAQAEGQQLILAIGGEAVFSADPVRQGIMTIFRLARYSEDGAVDTFETSTAKDDTPVLQLDTFRVPVDVKTGKINRIHYRLNPTNAATYTLRLWRNSEALNYRSNYQMLWESPPLQVDDTDYIEEDLDIPFFLTLTGVIWVGIEWTAAPGVTPGFIEVSGEKWS